MTLIVSSECERGEMQRPDAVVDSFEGDEFSGESAGQKQRLAFQETQPLLPTNRTSQ